MSSTGKSTEDEPPSYNVIAPYAPPDTYPPTAPPPETDLTLLKGVPPGLEHLLQLNQLSVREKFKVSQGWRSRSFDVLNNVGQRVFQAEATINFCGPLYDAKIRDNAGTDVLHLLENCGCICCTREMEVFGSTGSSFGSAKLHWNNMITHMSILNASKELVLLIVGPRFQTCIFGNCTFEVKSRDEQHVVGAIRMEGDQFLVSFPLDLEVVMKAVLLGAAMYLEDLIIAKRRQMERRTHSN
ncbi:phospholipid scramblase 3-like [Gastrophryne carolinensis]